MPIRRLVFAVLLLGSLAPPLTAQDTTAYAGLESRAIKALSDEQVRQLEAGDGMGLALAAELNHYPGPKHALELADSLGLSVAQRTALRAIAARMRADARALGAEVLARERELDGGFAAGTIDSTSLARLTADLGRLQGALRYAHLAAHLAVTRVLSSEQRHAYDRLRGYARGGRQDHRHEP